MTGIKSGRSEVQTYFCTLYSALAELRSDTKPVPEHGRQMTPYGRTALIKTDSLQHLETIKQRIGDADARVKQMARSELCHRIGEVERI